MRDNSNIEPQRSSFTKPNKFDEVCPMFESSSSCSIDYECPIDRAGPIHSIPSFDQRDFDVGKFLGAGSFCGVFEASLSARYMKKQKAQMRNNDTQESSPSVVAIKKVQGSGLSDHRREHAQRDLLHESHLLSSLDHKNIIRIYGTGPLDGDIICDKNRHPFIVLEKLTCTLEDRLQLWRKNKKGELFRTRLQVAASIASALAYLHSNGIVFRDLKPSNVGFDIYGNVKLFDLGLSVRADSTDDRRDEYCGTPRYMAPEVFHSSSNSNSNSSCCSKEDESERFNHNAYAVDVYSFGILLWEIGTLKKPFGESVSVKTLRKKVIEGTRPKIPSDWNRSLQYIVQSSWSSDVTQRPTMSLIQRLLECKILSRDQIDSPSVGRMELMKQTIKGRRRFSSV